MITFNGDVVMTGEDGRRYLGVVNISFEPADLNQDGVVDDKDVDILKEHYGTDHPEGDITGDGKVDGADFAAIKDNLVSSTPKKIGDFKRWTGTYSPKRIWFIDNMKGNDKTAAQGDSTKPYKTWQAAFAVRQPGDMFVFRGGVYKGDYVLGMGDPGGTAKDPIVFKAMTGEEVVLEGEQCIGMRDTSHLIWEGFTCTGGGSQGQGVNVDLSHDITFRNLTIEGHTRGIFGNQGLSNITVENCKITGAGTHGIYFGARDIPNQPGIVIRNNLISGCGRHGIQHNGRVTGMTIEKNIIHSNKMGGLSLICGARSSIIRNNLIFSNGEEGIVLYSYHDTDPSEVCGVTRDNKIYGNIIWQTDGPAVLFNDGYNKGMYSNSFTENILVGKQGVFRYFQPELVEKNIVGNNLLWGREDRIVTIWNEYASPGVTPVYLDFHEAEELSTFQGNTYANPHFTCTEGTPEQFDFSREE